jgi:acetate kinase
VFTGGIGASAAPVRAEICHGLAVLGVAFDDQRNGQSDRVISAPISTVVVRALPTDQQLVTARRTCATLASVS